MQLVEMVEKDPFDVVTDTLQDWLEHLAKDREVERIKPIRDQFNGPMKEIETEDEV